MDKPTNPEDQAKLAAALLDPSIYGFDVNRVDKLETHISYVFLAGPSAYKVKKAVDLGFLNFSTLSDRHYYCQEELRLNRRFSSSLYLEVIPITGSIDHPILGGDGPPIEYAVKMRQFPQDQLLDRLLAQKQLTSYQIDKLAAKIAEFHASAAIASADAHFGTPDAIQQPALENFSQIKATISGTMDLADLDFLEKWTTHNCAALNDVFQERKNAGFVRECHGDFHLGNVALVNGEITIFDCLEFNENLRWIDTMNEVGFMVMDLQEKNRPDLAWRFLNTYLEISGDYAGLRVLRFYVTYRAMVRAKVHLMRSHQRDISAEQKPLLIAEYSRYVALGKLCATTSQPLVLITHGLSGSGKTTLTQSVLEKIGAVRIRSDVERKRMHGFPASERTKSAVGKSFYSQGETTLTYHRLRDLAQTIVAAGYPVIVDATFLKRSQRDMLHELAMALGDAFIILAVTTDETIMRARILKRLATQNDASDADISVLEHQLETEEPLEAEELPCVVFYDSTGRLTSSGVPQIHRPFV